MKCLNGCTENKELNCNRPPPTLHHCLCRRTEGTWRRHREYVLHCNRWSVTSLRSRVAITH